MYRYVLALGSNRPHGRFGPPRRVIAAAVAQLAASGLRIDRQSRVITSLPLGPSHREYANSTLIVETPLPPPELLNLCKAIEHRFGRRRGRRWGARVIDIDIILWSGGRWATPSLTIPHISWADRPFVADGVADIARDWRIPGKSRFPRHAAAVLHKPRAFRATDG